MYKTFITAIILVAMALSASCAAAATNPFTGKGQVKESSPDSGFSAPPFLSPLLTKSAELQAEIRSRLTGFAADIKEKPFGGDFWLFILLSFAYGALHALGPGHGKLFAVSYFIGRPGSLVSGLMLGNLTMLAHVLSATLLVMAGFLLLHGSGAMAAESARDTLEAASFALLMLLGLFLAFRAVSNAGKGGHVHEIGRDRGGRSSLVLMALFGGLVPCPGATLILVYAVSQGIVGSGLAAMLAVSLGMGLTTSAFALGAIYSRGFLLGLAASRGRLLERLHLALTVSGALAIAALGAVMLLGKIQ